MVTTDNSSKLILFPEETPVLKKFERIDSEFLEM